MPKALKIIIYISATILWVYTCLWAAVSAAFYGRSPFYFALILICCAVVLLYVTIHVFRIAAPKKMKTAWLVFLSLTVASCAVHEGIKSYDKSIARVREDFDLTPYAPFAQNTLTASLDTPSTLTLTSDLPRLDGATALYPVYSAFARAVYPENNYYIFGSEVSCHNTVSAYANLIDGSADIIFVSRPSQEQLQAAEEAGVEFSYTPIGVEAFVFFVNSRNPVDELTTEQLRDIYSGRTTNWRDLGGRNNSVRPFQREAGSGSQSTFVRFMDGINIIEPPVDKDINTLGRMFYVAADYTNYGNAIGFSSLFSVNEMAKNKKVKILKINDVYPDIEAVANGTYPLPLPFYAVTLSGNDKSNVAEFLKWITSPQGQYLVGKAGYCPAS